MCSNSGKSATGKPSLGDFAGIPGIKIPNPGNKNPETKKIPNLEKIPMTIVRKS